MGRGGGGAGRVRGSGLSETRISASYKAKLEARRARLIVQHKAAGRIADNLASKEARAAIERKLFEIDYGTAREIALRPRR